LAPDKMMFQELDVWDCVLIIIAVDLSYSGAFVFLLSGES